ncbi:MAG: hypothetical protein IJQ25_08225, partial [Oscillibacter sp.]|nr:hypothetical protein [Oscillibacter sp.]
VLVSDVQFCGGRRKEDNAAPAETMKDGNGDTWTRGQFGGWVQNEAPAGDPQGNFTFRDGPTGMGETVDIPF